MHNETSPLAFNFWPSFADSMLGLVLVMTLLFVIALYGMGKTQRQAKQSAESVDSLEHVAHSLQSQVKNLKGQVRRQQEKIREQTVEITEIRNRQDRIREEIARFYDGQVERIGNLSSQNRPASEEPRYVVYNHAGQRMIDIYYDIQLQRLTFNGNILFDPNEYALSPEGKNLLRVVGKAIDDEIASIERIQIEGHTDNRPTTQYRNGNLELGALRAISVYKFFEKSPGIMITPDRHAMSVTSFGSYQSVASNTTAKGRARNRRIELLLFFERGSEPDSLGVPTD